jgi:hypothetical protein
MKNPLLPACLLLLLCVVAHGGEGKHLFILSGQSNMAGLDPNESFTPTVEAAFGTDAVMVVKDAQGGQPIRRWYKQWKPAEGTGPEATGDLYDRLMARVNAAIVDQRIQTVTFVWMQGERDAREKHGDVYARSLEGLLDQLAADLRRSDINFVLGRLSDFDMEDKRYPHWTHVRKAQVEFAAAHPRRAWVNTDDLNDGKNRRGKEIANDLHYSAEGYKEFGRRLAEKAIELITSMIFEEDFEKGHDRWETTDAKSWTYRRVGGNHVFGINRRNSDYRPPVRSPLHIALIQGVKVADFVMTFRVRSTKDTGGHRDCCVFFNYQNPQQFYYVHLGARPDPHSGQIMIVNNAPRTALTRNTNEIPWKNDTWHRVKLVRDTASGTIEVFFDDMTKPRMSVVDKTFGSGRIGIGSFDDMNDFDDIGLRGR